VLSRNELEYYQKPNGDLFGVIHPYYTWGWYTCM